MDEIRNDWVLPEATSAWLEPHTLSSPAPWAGHIPFAAWLMATLRPRTLVELGAGTLGRGRHAPGEPR